MIDTLFLTAKNPHGGVTSFRESSPALIKNETTLGARALYKRSTRFEVNNDDGSTSNLTVREQPDYPTAAPLRLELSPFTTRTFDRLVTTLSEFADPENLSIVRIDHAVDVPVATSVVLQSAFSPRKNYRSDFVRGRPSGIYIGKKPEQLCIYDRARKLHIDGDLTRIELRQWGNRASVPTLAALPDLLTRNPFEELRFYSIRKPIPNDSARTRERLHEAASAIEGSNFMLAFQRLNEHNNFRRNYEEFLDQEFRVPDLWTIYRAELEAFFGLAGHGVE